MCGRSFARHGREFGAHHRNRHGEFFGLESEEMSSRLQVAAAALVLVPVALSGVVLLALAPGSWWIFTTYGWVSFPAFGLLVRGVADLSEARSKRDTPKSRERELLGVLREYGEVSPAFAAVETSLSVEEADEMLGALAEGGHLEVLARGGSLHYALWESMPGGKEWRASRVPELATEPAADGCAGQRGDSE